MTPASTATAPAASKPTDGAIALERTVECVQTATESAADARASRARQPRERSAAAHPRNLEDSKGIQPGLEL